MIVMAYAHARTSGDSSLLTNYYHLLKTWADYLVSNSLVLQGQADADGLNLMNGTNLAVKGIIAIQVMSSISAALGQTSDAQAYSSNVLTMMQQWQAVSLSQDFHILASYNQASSWTLGYNIFLDKWLDTSIVDLSIFDAQMSFLQQQLASTPAPSGLPVDSVHPNVTGPYWSALIASVATNATIRNDLISRVHSQVSASQPDQPYALGGSSNGAFYSLLALTMTAQPVSGKLVSASDAGDKHPSLPIIAASVTAGSVALLSFIILAVFFWWRRRATARRKGRTLSLSRVISKFNTGDDCEYLKSPPSRFATAAHGSECNRDSKRTSTGSALGPEQRTRSLEGWAGLETPYALAYTLSPPSPALVSPAQAPQPSTPSVSSSKSRELLEEELAAYNRTMLNMSEYSHFRTKSGTLSSMSGSSESAVSHGLTAQRFNSKLKEREQLKRELDVIMMHLGRLDAAPPSYYDEGLSWAI